MLILDQDDYIIIQNKDGEKRILRGPCPFKPIIGESWSGKLSSVSVPLNKYIIVRDTND